MNSSKAVTRDAIRPGRGTYQGCRYDAYRSDLLNQLRAKLQTETGKPYLSNNSLIVQDALDRLLTLHGLLPKDAPPYSDVASTRKVG